MSLLPSNTEKIVQTLTKFSLKGEKQLRAVGDGTVVMATNASKGCCVEGLVIS